MQSSLVLPQKVQSLVSMPDKKAFLFDIDGVLVDVEESYIDTTRQTITKYLNWFLNVPASRSSLLSRKDIHDFKLLGGFNNDWDTVWGILTYLDRLRKEAGKDWSAMDLSELKKAINIASLREQLPCPCGIKGIAKWNKPDKRIDYEKAKDLFQQIYLGTILYKKLYRHKPNHIDATGLIHLEKPYIPANIFARLRKQGYLLGIVTGRARFEAEFILDRFKIKHYFSAIITHDDVVIAEKRTGELRRKPHPYPVIRCAQKLGVKKGFYLGDLPDDMRAAIDAKPIVEIVALGALYSAQRKTERRKELLAAGAQRIIRNVSDIAATQF